MKGTGGTFGGKVPAISMGIPPSMGLTLGGLSSGESTFLPYSSKTVQRSVNSLSSKYSNMECSNN